MHENHMTTILSLIIPRTFSVDSLFRDGLPSCSLHDLEDMMLQKRDEGCPSPDQDSISGVPDRGIIIDSISQLLLQYSSQEVGIQLI